MILFRQLYSSPLSLEIREEYHRTQLKMFGGKSKSTGDALHIFCVRGRTDEKGIDFPDIGIRNGIDFQAFRIKM